MCVSGTLWLSDNHFDKLTDTFKRTFKPKTFIYCTDQWVWRLLRCQSSWARLFTKQPCVVLLCVSTRAMSLEWYSGLRRVQLLQLASAFKPGDHSNPLAQILAIAAACSVGLRATGVILWHCSVTALCSIYLLTQNWWEKIGHLEKTLLTIQSIAPAHVIGSESRGMQCFWCSGKCGHNVVNCRMPVEWVHGHQL